MILKMRLGTMGGTDAFITTATMAVVTNLGSLGYCLAGDAWELGSGVIPSRRNPQNMSGCPWNDPEFRGATHQP